MVAPNRGVSSTRIFQALSDVLAQNKAPGGPVTEAASLVTVAGAFNVFPANVNRRFFQLVNTSDTIQVVRYGQTATASLGIILNPKESITLDDRFVPTSSVSVWCATAGKTFYAIEG